MKKNPRFEDDNCFVLKEPDITKILCKDCLYRAKDRANGKFKGATLGLCYAYDWKPPEILWEHKDCPYYTPGDPDEEDE